MKIKYAVAGLMLSMAVAAQATLIQPDSISADTGAVYSSPGDLTGSKKAPEELNSSYAAVNMINGSVSDETTVLEGLWVGGVWQSPSATDIGTLTFSFDSAVEFKSFVLWNSLSEIKTRAERGINEFKLRFYDSSENQIGDEYHGFAAVDDAADAYIDSQLFYLGETYSGVRHGELEILSIHGDANGYIAISELGFTDVIPEPATLAFVGIFGIGALAVRRIFMM
ncbi:MAG: hypothetical protein JXR25_12185 [Pontiellaceae bacterium]|nr:hypothetical protein [Pontiellaceae bacterium]MBN2785573.1 hypothetical protein [Pontiellaceae bacterium]